MLIGALVCTSNFNMWEGKLRLWCNPVCIDSCVKTCLREGMPERVLTCERENYDYDVVVVVEEEEEDFFWWSASIPVMKWLLYQWRLQCTCWCKGEFDKFANKTGIRLNLILFCCLQENRLLQRQYHSQTTTRCFQLRSLLPDLCNHQQLSFAKGYELILIDTWLF